MRKHNQIRDIVESFQFMPVESKQNCIRISWDKFTKYIHFDPIKISAQFILLHLFLELKYTHDYLFFPHSEHAGSFVIAVLGLEFLRNLWRGGVRLEDCLLNPFFTYFVYKINCLKYILYWICRERVSHLWRILL